MPNSISPYFSRNLFVEIVVGPETEECIIRQPNGAILSLHCTPSDVSEFLSECISEMKSSK